MCALHTSDPRKTPSLTVRVEGHPVAAMLDSGSTVTLARPIMLPKRSIRKGTVTVTRVRGDARGVPAAEVHETMVLVPSLHF